MGFAAVFGSPYVHPSLLWHQPYALRTLQLHVFIAASCKKGSCSHVRCLQVDAALDLSHTQNIGRMIKTHFPYSQFIVVSLKEGMFNNANVIYRTKFVDGVSAVTRTVPDKR